MREAIRRRAICKRAAFQGHPMTTCPTCKGRKTMYAGLWTDCWTCGGYGSVPCEAEAVGRLSDSTDATEEHIDALESVDRLGGLLHDWSEADDG